MNKVTVRRISFGFPTNITESISITDVDSIKTKDYKNKNVHLKISLDKELKKNFNQAALEEEIRLCTHAEKVRISFIYNTGSSERSKDVTNAQSVVDKFVKYAELNEIKYKDTVLSKIESIQDQMLVQNFVPNDTFELEYVSIRGAIGIWEGQKKEEIAINLKDDYSEGVIALIGKNGAGKSTLIELMSPYNSLLTRSGSLKDHFFLKDSHKILIYKNSRGKQIKISMFIDGKAVSVMTVYKVEYKEPDSDIWVQDRNINSAEEYKKWVESVFGPKDIYMRTAFFANKEIKSIPDLANATKSEKMELFSILAGTDYLTEISELAKEASKNENKIIEDIKGQLQNFDNIDERMLAITQKLENNSFDIDNYKKLIDIDNEQLELYTKEQEKYLAAAGAYDVVRTALTEKRVKIEENERELVFISNSIEGINQQLEDKELYEQQLAWYDENTAKLQDLHKLCSQLQDDKSKKDAEITKAELFNDKCNSIINESSQKLYKLQLENESLNKAIPKLDGNCPVCGAPLSIHKKAELEKEFIEINSTIEANKTHIEAFQNTIKSEKEKLIDLSTLKKEYSDIDNKILETLNDISEINDYAASLDIVNIKDILTNSEKKIKDLEEKRKKVIKEQEQLAETIKDLEFKMENIPEDYSDKITRLNRGIQDSQQNIAILSAENTALTRELNSLKTYEEKVKEIKVEIKEHQQNQKDYQIIQEAFSNNGIQALELDSAAPEISDITNAILSETYGDRFQVSFDTQRNAKNGKKIDDFIINVFDSESGRKKTLDILSSGESIWIKQALYYAFSVIRSRRTNFCFKTRFLDESDGALDNTARVKYLKMIELAHKMCNATQTILITHSSEIKEIVEQKIELTA